MQQRGPGSTALGVATLRAVHQLLDGTPKILDDPVAARLLDAGMVRRLRSNPAFAFEPAAQRLRAHVVLRNRYAEDRLAEAARRGVRQYVMLGAGFDTFAYRQPDWARTMRLYEVDHPAAQEEKRRRLITAGMPTPANLEFIALDLEGASLRDGLLASTLDGAEPVFFSCLGVLVYLSGEAVQAVFRLVASFPAGSEIVFTFSAPDASSSRLAHRAGELGEPWRTHVDPQTLEQDLRRWGFAASEFLSAEDAARTYFQGRSDGLPAPRRGSIAAALVSR